MTHWRSPRTPYEWDFFWAIVFTGALFAGAAVGVLFVIWQAVLGQ